VAGNSGPLDDVTWEDLAAATNGHIQPERTTVTKKIRRIGNFDIDMVVRAVEANGGPGIASVAVSFIDYIDPSLFGSTDPADLEASGAARDFLDEIKVQGIWIKMVTTGPKTAIW
jgi:adenylosuccinate synthase